MRPSTACRTRFAVVASLAVLCFGSFAAQARADDALALGTAARPAAHGPPRPDPALSVLVGGAMLLAGFAVGGTLLASGGDLGNPSDAAVAKTRAAWFAIESAFVVAPLSAHAVVGEWGRGALFASLPAATTLGTIPVFVEQPAAVEHGTLEEQRVMWGLFCGGLAAAVAGVVDAALATGRAGDASRAAALRVTPAVGAGHAGVVLGGTL
jgi:hypothetical protein